MQIINLLRGAVLTLATAGSVAASASGIFLRGDTNGWACDPAYEFTETSENVYTLHLDKLEREFKMASEDWTTVDLGSENSDKSQPFAVATGKYACSRGGSNFQVSGTLSDVTLTLEYVPDGECWLTIAAESEHQPVAGLSGTLPVIYIVTDPVMLSKDLDDKTYRDGMYYLDANGCDWAESIGSASEMLPLEIKARGNWTRLGFAKKPFKLKLGSKQKMLGLSKSKHFALLAHADDNVSYLRNFVGFNLGKRLGLPWTPSAQPVEVVMNGDYRGLYFLPESIRVESGRIEIEKLADEETDPALCSGGYLVELDNYEEGDQIIEEEENGDDVMRVTFDTPEVYSPLQRTFIEEQFTTMNRLVSSHDAALWSYMDMDMAARYYIVEEIIDHRESYHGSTYLFRDRGENKKWMFSPLWDCGNAFTRENPQSYFTDETIYGNLWINNMRQTPGFMDKVEETWRWFWGNKVGDNGADLISDIEAYIESLREAAKADRARWKDAPRPEYPGATDVVDNSDMDRGMNFVKNSLRSKVEWLSSKWGMPSAEAAEPAPDSTPAADLPNYLAGIEEVVVSGEGEVRAIYNLQGLPVVAPASGEIVIVVTEGKARKMIVR